MEFTVFTEPQQGFSYDDQLAFALAAERTGFDAFQMGDASAIAVITLLIAIAFTSVYLYVLNYREMKAALQ